MIINRNEIIYKYAHSNIPVTSNQKATLLGPGICCDNCLSLLNGSAKYIQNNTEKVANITNIIAKIC